MPAPLPMPMAGQAQALQSLREVRRGVAEAADAQVLRVVRMVDALEDRGATDTVLDPVRPRLRVMQPARPLRFARLLFTPLDPLIVPPKLWRAGTPLLPRTALMVLAPAVREHLRSVDSHGDNLARIDALIASANTAQASVMRQAGALLWPLASSALRGIGASRACAAAWSAEGLPAGALQPTALALATILARALALHDHDHAGVMLAEPTLLDMVTEAEAAGPLACGMMLSLLVIRVPQSAAALLAAAQTLPALRPLGDTAAETALDWLEGETADQSGSISDSAATDLARQAALLDALVDQPGPAARRRRMVEAKAHLLAGCLHRFEISLQDQVAGRLQTIADDPEARDAALNDMEATARTLRRFELEARRLGAGVKFDAMTHGVEATIAAAPGLSPMDRARLVEILVGPEAAMRMLG